MKRRRMFVAALATLAAAGLLAAGTAAAAATNGRDRKVAQMREATDQFHSIKAAEAAGYVPFQDINGISCIDEPGMGGMGVHYVNPQLINNPSIDARRPEALVYAPGADGKLHLAALEYLVVKAAWDAKHASSPQLFASQHFDETAAPNRFGLPDFYSQHVWVWKNNPAGLLAMWNPNVHCPA
jgi:hypothetical protein